MNYAEKAPCIRIENEDSNAIALVNRLGRPYLDTCEEPRLIQSLVSLFFFFFFFELLLVPYDDLGVSKIAFSLTLSHYLETAGVLLSLLTGRCEAHWKHGLSIIQDVNMAVPCILHISQAMTIPTIHDPLAQYTP